MYMYGAPDRRPVRLSPDVPRQQYLAMMDRTRTARFTVLILVVGAHLALALFWPATRLADTGSASRSSTLVLIARAPVEPEAKPPLLTLPPPAPLLVQPPFALVPEIRNSPAPTPKIDWTSAAHRAVTDALAAQEAEQRKSQGFTGRGPAMSTAPETRSKPEFGWQRWRLHRVEQLSQGGFVVHLNERCVLVVTALLMPACRIGKIAARGDLFEHMDDAPEPGDWKN